LSSVTLVTSQITFLVLSVFLLLYFIYYLFYKTSYNKALSAIAIIVISIIIQFKYFKIFLDLLIKKIDFLSTNFLYLFLVGGLIFIILITFAFKKFLKTHRHLFTKYLFPLIIGFLFFGTFYAIGHPPIVDGKWAAPPLEFKNFSFIAAIFLPIGIFYSIKDKRKDFSFMIIAALGLLLIINFQNLIVFLPIVFLNYSNLVYRLSIYLAIPLSFFAGYGLFCVLKDILKPLKFKGTIAAIIPLIIIVNLMSITNNGITRVEPRYRDEDVVAVNIMKNMVGDDDIIFSQPTYSYGPLFKYFDFNNIDSKFGNDVLESTSTQEIKDKISRYYPTKKRAFIFFGSNAGENKLLNLLRTEEKIDLVLGKSSYVLYLN
ncbi:MAG: hypothetical protein ACD_12C00297G0001, partial [uncultured bacterium]